MVSNSFRHSLSRIHFNFHAPVFLFLFNLFIKTYYNTQLSLFQLYSEVTLFRTLGPIATYFSMENLVVI